MFGKFIIVAAFALAILTGKLFGADLKITDSKGNVVEVRNVWVDYTNYPYVGSGLPGGLGVAYTPDHEAAGVRAHQGDGSITVRWERIESITIKFKPAIFDRGKLVEAGHFDADVTLKDKKVLALQLLFDSKDGLHGETDLGQFSIKLQNIANIVVLPTRAKP